MKSLSAVVMWVAPIALAVVALAIALAVAIIAAVTRRVVMKPRAVAAAAAAAVVVMVAPADQFLDLHKRVAKVPYHPTPYYLLSPPFQAKQLKMC